MTLDIDYYIIRVRQLPPKTAAKKAMMKLLRATRNKFEKETAKLSPAHISDEQLLQSLDGFKNIDEVLHAIRGERPPFIIQPSPREELVSLIQQQFPHLVIEIEEEAEKVCNHLFDLLGSGPVDLDEFAAQHGGREACGYLPWHHDFKTGYHWSPKKYYKEIEIPYGKADIKVPWELSRFQHAAALGQAYWLTGDEKYAQEFVRQIYDWIDRNPPKFGVNWACAMDVAIRAASWILGFYFFKDSKTFSDDFLVKFTKSLLTHGRHIMANLENRGITNNHYLSDLVGLIYLGIAFPEFKEACRWRDFGIQELIIELDKQVYDDGMDFEASTCYHRLALELFFYPALLCRLNGIELPQAFTDKLKKMFDFVLYVLKPNGKMPQIGDNDNGRLHILGIRDILDMTYLLSFAALLYDDADYKIDEFGFAPEALFIFGPKAFERWSRLSGRSVEELGSRAFPNGGIYVMRHNKDYMAISCRPRSANGLGLSGHAHNDALGFELCIGGEDVIVDPGTYVYTPNPEERHKFRSAAFHNMVIVSFSQIKHFGVETCLFRTSEVINAQCLKWCDQKEISIFAGELNTFDDLNRIVMLHREIVHLKLSGSWVITDTISDLRGFRAEWNFCLKPHANLPNIVSQDLQWKQTPGYYSGGYGELCPCTWLTYDMPIKSACIVQFTIMKAFETAEPDMNA